MSLPFPCTSVYRVRAQEALISVSALLVGRNSLKHFILGRCVVFDVSLAQLQEHVLAMTSDDLKSLASKCAPLHATVDSRCALYVPFGFLLVEQAMSSMDLLGIKCTALFKPNQTRLASKIGNARIVKELGKMETAFLDELLSALTSVAGAHVLEHAARTCIRRVLESVDV